MKENLVVVGDVELPLEIGDAFLPSDVAENMRLTREKYDSGSVYYKLNRGFPEGDKEVWFGVTEDDEYTVAVEKISSVDGERVEETVSEWKFDSSESASRRLYRECGVEKDS